jgi:hypothetical protein
MGDIWTIIGIGVLAAFVITAIGFVYDWWWSRHE